MKITQTQFWIVFFLFLLMPFSIHWRLIAFGKKTTGVAVEQITEHTKHVENIMSGSTFTKIQYQVNDSVYYFHAPEDVKYEPGKEITILYNTKNPKESVMFNFAGMVLTPRMYIPAILLIVWIAFFRTIKDLEQKKNRY